MADVKCDCTTVTKLFSDMLGEQVDRLDGLKKEIEKLPEPQKSAVYNEYSRLFFLTANSQQALIRCLRGDKD